MQKRLKKEEEFRREDCNDVEFNDTGVKKKRAKKGQKETQVQQ